MVTFEVEMAKLMEIPIKGEILKWARTTAGYDISQAARELDITPNTIIELESPSVHSISKTLLNRISRLYKRSEMVLFLPEPPTQDAIPTDYRRLPNEQTAIGPDTANSLREAKRYQDILSDLSDEPGKGSAFNGVHADYTQDPATVGSKIRDLINVNFSEQSSWRDSGYAFRTWRGKVQELGIGVYLGDFPRTEARGFSLWHPEKVPMIVVTKNEAPVAQSFTLFHELAHIVLRSDAMCIENEDDSLLGRVETWCNRVAAATLIPESDLRNVLMQWGKLSIQEWTASELSQFANPFKVSRHAIAIRLESIGLAYQGYYNRIKNQLTYDEPRPRRRSATSNKGFKRDTPRERLAEVGFLTANTILEACRSSILSTIETANLLGVKPSKFERLSKLAAEQRQRYAG